MMDANTDLKRVTITMPEWMLEDLRRRAKVRGITVTELMRRAVSRDRMLSSDTCDGEAAGGGYCTLLHGHDGDHVWTYDDEGIG